MSKSILIIDDSKTMRLQVRAAIADAGYEILEAENGREGLERLGAHRNVALVICDVNMPEMNGLDMLEAAKKDERFKMVPIVMLTTEGQPELIKRASAAGAKGWIVKPFKPELLRGAVQKLAGPA